MRTATAVIGANFGDEGKGLMVDYFAEQALKDSQQVLVVRFNGGAQAGHTVVRSSYRHVFNTYGSGTLCNVRTFLGPNVFFNPIMFIYEHEKLENLLQTEPKRVLIHPKCPITTVYDMLLNQAAETHRGKSRP